MRAFSVLQTRARFAPGAAVFRTTLVISIAVATPLAAQDFDARAYVDGAITVVRENALLSPEVDWPVVIEEAHRLAAGAEAPVDAYPAILYLVRELNDRHSSFIPAPESAAEFIRRMRETLGEGGARPGLDTTFSRRRAIEYADLESEKRQVRWIVVPRFSGDSTAANAFANTLHRAVTSDPLPCGYVIDFRGNGGGDMWPMLAGLSPLLSNGELGRFSGPTESSVIFHRDGAVGIESSGELILHRIADWERRADLESAPVAILIDSGSLSSGEIVPIMLIGRPATRVFGTPSFGIPTANRRVPLPDGAAIMLTVAETRDRFGKAYPNGVVPDEYVTNPYTGSLTDPPLEAARSWLLQRCTS